MLLTLNLSPTRGGAGGSRDACGGLGNTCKANGWEADSSLMCGKTFNYWKNPQMVVWW